MDTGCEEKRAASGGALETLGLARTMSGEAFKAYLALAAGLGLVGGGGAGMLASAMKAKNPEVQTLNRRKRFYDAQVKEMENTNWLNDIMAAKKKLETGRLTPEERRELEDKYMELIGR